MHRAIRSELAIVGAIVLVLVAFACAPLAILGGPTGPVNCPNGRDYGDAGTCCPPGFAVSPYGKCESNEAPMPTAWGARRSDAGGPRQTPPETEAP